MGSMIRAHIRKAAKQLRGAIGTMQSRDEVTLATPQGSLAASIGDRALRGLIVVREMFDDDYKACSAPVLAVAEETGVPCVLLDYAAFHMMTLHLRSPRRLINGFDQVFARALEIGEYPKPRFLGAPVSERPNDFAAMIVARRARTLLGSDPSPGPRVEHSLPRKAPPQKSRERQPATG
jgi:hypothetical protein